MAALSVFNYSDHFFYKLAAASDLARPVQLELHPGVNCDLYRCHHCYGHGQDPMPGELLSPEEIGVALDDIAASSPTVILSGITTEPLTHPRAADVIRQIRGRDLSLGLYTKGRRLEGEVAEALLDGSAECFLTISLDDVGKADYDRRHFIATAAREKGTGLSGDGYYERVISNLREFRQMRDAVRARVQIRVALLLFADNCEQDQLVESVEAIAELADVVRIAIPQDRNDGAAPGLLPMYRSTLLHNLEEVFACHPKVRILRDTFDPQRSQEFSQCRVQQFQAVLDRSGNVFPCPQVAVSPYRHLSYGNIRKSRLSEILVSEQRRSMFNRDIDKDMKCRICDRKDEAVNVALNRLAVAYQ